MKTYISEGQRKLTVSFSKIPIKMVRRPFWCLSSRIKLHYVTKARQKLGKNLLSVQEGSKKGCLLWSRAAAEVESYSSNEELSVIVVKKTYCVIIYTMSEARKRLNLTFFKSTKLLFPDWKQLEFGHMGNNADSYFVQVTCFRSK